MEVSVCLCFERFEVTGKQHVTEKFEFDSEKYGEFSFNWKAILVFVAVEYEETEK